MEVLDIGLTIPAILPPTIVTTMVFQRMRVLKCLREMEYGDIVIVRPASYPLSILEFIIVVMMVEVDIGLKRLATFTLAIMEFIILVTMV